MKTFKQIILILCIIAMLVGIGFLIYGYVNKGSYKAENPVATIEVKDYGTIKVKLYPDVAPNTVTNFIALANNGFYDGLTFYETNPQYRILAGDSSKTATLSNIDSSIEKGSSEDKKYAIEGEFSLNGYDENTLKFEKGVIAMERYDYSKVDSSLETKGYNSANSQFFIMNADNQNLNRVFAGFGKVIEGLDIVDKIANVEVVTRDENAKEGLDKPVSPPVISSIRVETYGVDYGKPKTIEPFNYYNWLMNNYYSSSSN